MASLPSQKTGEILSEYNINDNNTLAKEAKSDAKDRIEIEIGDSKQPDFKPQIKVMRWNNEVNFSMRAEEHPNATVEFENNVIKYKTPNYEVHQFNKPDAGEDGGHEFEWLLLNKPFINVLTATIQTKGLNFFYQPPFTQKEIDEGNSRPENVTGSYAVYHSTKGVVNDAAGMEYKVGKAFHIYRPKVIDNMGNETWGELNIDVNSGLLTVTINQTWLDNASYPVTVDPTFGYTSIGASTVDISIQLASKFTSATDFGTVTQMSIYNKTQGGTSTTGGAFYSDVSSSPSALLAQGSVGGVTTTPGWHDMSVSYAGSPSTIYWLAERMEAAYTIYRDAGDTNQEDASLAGATFADPWVSFAQEDYKISIYATYTSISASVNPSKRTLLGVGI